MATKTLSANSALADIHLAEPAFTKKHWFRKRMMLISMSFRTVTDKYTKDKVFMKFEDYDIFMKRIPQMASVHCTTLSVCIGD
jgi:hypothetical protein